MEFKYSTKNGRIPFKKERLFNALEERYDSKRNKNRHKAIDSDTFERFKEARNCYEQIRQLHKQFSNVYITSYIYKCKKYLQITTRTLQQWALIAAAPFQSDTFSFNASDRWIKLFKLKHRIKQRKITKYVSRRDVVTLDETVKAAERFQA